MNFHQWNISRKRRLTYFNRKKKGSTNSIREKTRRFINFIINLIKRAIKNEAKLTEKFISSNHSSFMLITKNVNFQFHDFHKNRRINFTRHFLEARNWNTTKQKKKKRENFHEKIFDDSRVRENECFKFRYFEISVENVSSRNWLEIFKLPFKNSILGPSKKLRVKAWTMLWHTISLADSHLEN